MVSLNWLISITSPYLFFCLLVVRQRIIRTSSSPVSCWSRSPIEKIHTQSTSVTTLANKSASRGFWLWRTQRTAPTWTTNNLNQLHAASQPSSITPKLLQRPSRKGPRSRERRGKTTYALGRVWAFISILVCLTFSLCYNISIGLTQCQLLHPKFFNPIKRLSRHHIYIIFPLLTFYSYE